jgi:WD40 repeat protein
VTALQFAKKAAESALDDARREKTRADEEAKAAIRATDVANRETSRAYALNKELDVEKQKLNDNVKELELKTEEAQSATDLAKRAQAYQEAVNILLALKDKVDKRDFKADEELKELLTSSKEAFEKYTKASSNLRGISLPNNDLYQILLKARSRMIEDGIFLGIPGTLHSSSAGIRKISISPRGNLAAGGDDGILLYSKEPYNQNIGQQLNKFSLFKDRIRSIEFVNDKELVMGTVNGKLYHFNTVTGINKLLEIGVTPNQIIEKVVASSKGVFVLVGDQIRKVPLSELSRTAAGPKELPKTVSIPKELPKTVAIPKELPKTAAVSGFFTKYEQVPNLSVKSIFKFNEDKLLVVSKENTLVLLDMATLKWQPITNDLKKVAITAAVNSGDNLFLGMESGEVIFCKNLKLGNVISLQTDLVITAHKTRITSLAYDESSNKLFSASLDQTANIFDLNVRKLENEDIANYLLKIEGFDKWIWDFGLIQTGKVKTLLTVDESGEMKSWQTGSEMLYNEIFAAINK